MLAKERDGVGDLGCTFKHIRTGKAFAGKATLTEYVAHGFSQLPHRGVEVEGQLLRRDG